MSQRGMFISLPKENLSLGEYKINTWEKESLITSKDKYFFLILQKTDNNHQFIYLRKPDDDILGVKYEGVDADDIDAQS